MTNSISKDIAVGDVHEDVFLETADEIKEALRSFVKTSKNDIVILSQALDNNLFHDRELVDLCAVFAKNRRSHLRIIVNDHSPLIRNLNFFAELAIRFSSKVEIREADKSDALEQHTFVVFDQQALVDITNIKHYRAKVSGYSPRLARELHESFDTIWEQAHRIPSLKALKI